MYVYRQRVGIGFFEQAVSNRCEFVVLYGRHRVGKTALINHFIADNPSLYFMGVESNAKQNPENFNASIHEYYSGIRSTETSFLSFRTALDMVFQLSLNKRIILAIDEYPYVAKSSKSFSSTLQLLIDKYRDNSKLMLILCGSSMSYMEDHVLAYIAPLYGRRTAQMKLLPFSFDETCRYFTHFTAEEKALAYRIIGGTPQYLLQMNDLLSIKENITNIYLNI